MDAREAVHTAFDHINSENPKSDSAEIGLFFDALNEAGFAIVARSDIAAVLTVYDAHTPAENAGVWRDRLAESAGYKR